MSRYDPIISIRHMYDHAMEAIGWVQNQSRSDLDTDRKLQLALVRLMEIVGEAATRIPGELRDRYPSVPWRDISDLRNRLIHGYDAINLDILWAIMTADLPILVDELRMILESEEAKF